MSDLETPLIIGIGAILGALSRYVLTRWATQRWGAQFPYGTLLVNLSGSGLMGLIVTLLLGWAEQFPSVDLHSLHLLFVVGFLGSYTTFSTYALDTARLMQRHNRSAWVYGLGSLILGWLSLGVGIALAKLWLRG